MKLQLVLASLLSLAAALPNPAVSCTECEKGAEKGDEKPALPGLGDIPVVGPIIGGGGSGGGAGDIPVVGPIIGGGGSGGGGGAFNPCAGALYSNPQCCSTDVLGVADLDCANGKFSPCLVQPTGTGVDGIRKG
jgi:hypothetical protein